MFTGTQKWVYESTEIIPYKKMDCKRFAVFVPKCCKNAHFEALVFDFQSLEQILYLLLLIFYRSVACNCFVAFFAYISPD